MCSPICIPDAFTTPGLSDHELLLAAKNHYWKALKLHPDDDNFAHQLRTNLGTTLRKSGRIAEALAAYDDVLASDPSFTMAHFQRGFALLALERLSGTVSTTQLQRARTDYVFVAHAADAAPGVRESAEKMRKYLTKHLGNKAGSAAEQQDTLDEEARQHSAYRQFTLLHHVGLAEHGLYCHCNGARRDDLMVAAHRTPVTGDHIPRCELILNRLKAEFGTARLLYYEATHDHVWNPHDEEITYADLFEGEQLSMRTELLRTSFRLCLGILDKIAHGICELYDVAEHHERLYFESFWRPAARKGKASTRWDTLATKSKNPSLVALYSQATDLASAGEWALFKAWRNDLEHRFLILTRQPAPSDLLKAREGTFATRCVPVKEFTNRTLHLLQFTRSAIFNFTYCVRAESRADEDEPGFMMTLLHK